MTGATVQTDFTLKSRVRDNMRNIALVFEINQAFDWSWYFREYPQFSSEPYYITNGEPSLVYRAEIDLDNVQDQYEFQLVGFGHYAGGTGQLYTEFTDSGEKTNLRLPRAW